MPDYVERTNEGNFTVRSTDEDDLARVTLSASGFQVMCTFLCLLPYKKPQWVEVGDMEKSVMTAGASDVGRSHLASRRMKMAYEYTRITQVFTINSVPKCWVYPVSLLLQAFCSHLPGSSDLVVAPNFPDEESLAAQQDLYFTELVPGKEYQTKLPAKCLVAGQSDLDIDRATCSGLTEADLSLL